MSGPTTTNPRPLDPFRPLPRDAWRALPPADLERAYMPSTVIPAIAPELAAYADRSAAARAALPVATHRYGPGPDELLDAVPVAAPGSPLHVFVHGGYWQQLSRADSASMAPGLHAQGVAFAAVGYTLAPAATLTAIVDQVCRALAWCLAHAPDLGADPTRVVVSGSSAGAHLAAMALTRVSGIAAAALLSGVYDLAPVARTSVDDALRLTPDEIRTLSPLDLAPLPAHDGAPPRVLVAVGEVETPEFHRHSAALADTWRARGVPVAELLAPARNHFDLVHDLGDPSTPLGQAVHRLTFG